MKTVTFVPRRIAEKMQGDDSTILISVVHSDQPLPIHNDGWASKHYFVFDDITMAVPGKVEFSIDHADSISALVKENMYNVVVHCEAGMSRSAAIAKWIADNYDYQLHIHPDGIGTDKHYNDYVYRVLNASVGKDLATYYQTLEMNAFINPDMDD